MAAYSSVLGLIWRRSGYGRGVSKLVCRRGGGCFVSRFFSSVGSVSNGRMSPWLMLMPEEEGGDGVYKFFSLAEKRVMSFNWSAGNSLDFDPFHRCARLVGTSRGWLGVVNYTTGDMSLINPITRRHVKLPSLHPLGDTVSQIILSCSPDEEEGECRALIVYDGLGRLAFCCPGQSDAKWTLLGDRDNDLSYKSFAYSKRQKLFFSATKKGLVAWNLGDPLSPKRIPIDFSLGEQYGSMDKYLVINEDTDDLFVVNHKWPRENTLDVHRYDPESGTFRHMKRGGSSLDGLSFFIGRNMDVHIGFALPADEFPELKPNSIYLAQYMVDVFSYKDTTVSPLHELPRTFLPTLSWFTPNSTSN